MWLESDPRCIQDFEGPEEGPPAITSVFLLFFNHFIEIQFNLLNKRCYLIYLFKAYHSITFSIFTVI